MLYALLSGEIDLAATVGSTVDNISGTKMVTVYSYIFNAVPEISLSVAPIANFAPAGMENILAGCLFADDGTGVPDKTKNRFSAFDSAYIVPFTSSMNFGGVDGAPGIVVNGFSPTVTVTSSGGTVTGTAAGTERSTFVADVAGEQTFTVTAGADTYTVAFVACHWIFQLGLVPASGPAGSLKAAGVATAWQPTTDPVLPASGPVVTEVAGVPMDDGPPHDFMSYIAWADGTAAGHTKQILMGSSENAAEEPTDLPAPTAVAWDDPAGSNVINDAAPLPAAPPSGPAANIRSDLVLDGSTTVATALIRGRPRMDSAEIAIPVGVRAYLMHADEGVETWDPAAGTFTGAPAGTTPTEGWLSSQHTYIVRSSADPTKKNQAYDLAALPIEVRGDGGANRKVQCTRGANTAALPVLATYEKPRIVSTETGLADPPARHEVRTGFLAAAADAPVSTTSVTAFAPSYQFYTQRDNRAYLGFEGIGPAHLLPFTHGWATASPPDTLSKASLDAGDANPVAVWDDATTEYVCFAPPTANGTTVRFLTRDLSTGTYPAATVGVYSTADDSEVSPPVAAADATADIKLESLASSSDPFVRDFVSHLQPEDFNTAVGTVKEAPLTLTAANYTTIASTIGGVPYILHVKIPYVRLAFVEGNVGTAIATGPIPGAFDSRTPAAGGTAVAIHAAATVLKLRFSSEYAGFITSFTVAVNGGTPVAVAAAADPDATGRELFAVEAPLETDTTAVMVTWACASDPTLDGVEHTFNVTKEPTGGWMQSCVFYDQDDNAIVPPTPFNHYPNIENPPVRVETVPSTLKITNDPGLVVRRSVVAPGTSIQATADVVAQDSVEGVLGVYKIAPSSDTSLKPGTTMKVTAEYPLPEGVKEPAAARYTMQLDVPTLQAYTLGLDAAHFGSATTTTPNFDADADANKIFVHNVPFSTRKWVGTFTPVAPLSGEKPIDVVASLSSAAEGTVTTAAVDEATGVVIVQANLTGASPINPLLTVSITTVNASAPDADRVVRTHLIRITEAAGPLRTLSFPSPGHEAVNAELAWSSSATRHEVGVPDIGGDFNVKITAATAVKSARVKYDDGSIDVPTTVPGTLSLTKYALSSTTYTLSPTPGLFGQTLLLTIALASTEAGWPPVEYAVLIVLSALDNRLTSVLKNPALSPFTGSTVSVEHEIAAEVGAFHVVQFEMPSDDTKVTAEVNDDSWVNAVTDDTGILKTVRIAIDLLGVAHTDDEVRAVTTHESTNPASVVALRRGSPGLAAARVLSGLRHVKPGSMKWSTPASSGTARIAVEPGDGRTTNMLITFTDPDSTGVKTQTHTFSHTFTPPQKKTDCCTKSECLTWTKRIPLVLFVIALVLLIVFCVLLKRGGSSRGVLIGVAVAAVVLLVLAAVFWLWFRT